jgi:hypothetical protein
MGRTYEAREPRYVKGDRVWVLRAGGVREPGVVIGHYIKWDSYRVVYTADQYPRAIEEWRLSFRKKGEEHWQSETPTSEGASPSVLTSDRRERADEARSAVLVPVELAGDLVQADAVADGPAVRAGGGEAAGQPALHQGLHLLLREFVAHLYGRVAGYGG